MPAPASSGADSSLPGTWCSHLHVGKVGQIPISVTLVQSQGNSSDFDGITLDQNVVRGELSDLIAFHAHFAQV